MDANDNWLWASCWHPEQADLRADSPVCHGLAGLQPLVARPALARVTLVGIFCGGLRPGCRMLLAGWPPGWLLSWDGGIWRGWRAGAGRPRGRPRLRRWG